jgi:hypothetical protein
MPRKRLEVPPAAVKAVVKDTRAFHAAASSFERDEIAFRQMHALWEHKRPAINELLCLAWQNCFTR